MERTLVVVRHAKSDWDVPAGDRGRPLSARGRRQAPETGRWLARHLGQLDLAVVSVAARAQQTWELVAEQLPQPPAAREEEDAYTFSGDDLVDLVRDLPPDADRVALVGHNPAVEELVVRLTGEPVRMPTAALAVVALPAWDAGPGLGRLRAAGRPSDGEVTLAV